MNLLESTTNTIRNIIGGIMLVIILCLCLSLTACKNYKEDNKYEEMAEYIVENAAEHYLGLEDDELDGMIDVTPWSDEVAK